MSTSIPSRSLELPRKILIFLAILAVGHYLYWRSGTLNPDYPIFSMVLFLAEIMGVFVMGLHVFMLWKLSVRRSPVPEQGLSVDVFIPTINESVDIVRRTALKAQNMHYAHKTWILDDGRRPEIKAMAEELGCGYIARSTNEHAKAGNLNHALRKTSGEFIAIFDADHAPASNFLMKTLGYFTDSNVAFVQTPQDFYNLDSYQHRSRVNKGRLWSEQSLFFRVIQRGKDVWNAAFFCGSCAIIRRSSLLEIGGFATGTITEDLHTSLKLHKAGFRSIYHAESLAFGIAAAHIEPFLRQRIRWGQGAMQVWKKEPILFSRRLTIAQKLCYLTSIITYFEGWQKAIYYFTPAFVLLTGWIPIRTTTGEFMQNFVPYLVMSIWAFHEIGRGYARVMIIEQYNMIRFAAFCWSTLGLFTRNLKFRVTNKSLTGGLAAQDWFLVPQYTVFAVSAAGIVLGAFFFARFNYMTSFAFSANVVWATVNMCLAMMVLVFTIRRMRYARNDYRFVLPLVARVQLGSGFEKDVTIENISSRGCRLVIPAGVPHQPGQRVTGQIHLPQGVIPFKAHARSFTYPTSHTHSYMGVEFDWDDSAARNQLEMFLYGSDLELQVNGMNEHRPTFLEAATQRLHKVEEDSGALKLAKYGKYRPHPMQFSLSSASQSEQQAGIFLHNNARKDEHLAMMFSPVAAKDTIEIQMFDGEDWQNMAANVVNENKVDFEDNSFYLYRLKGQKPHASPGNS